MVMFSEISEKRCIKESYRHSKAKSSWCCYVTLIKIFIKHPVGCDAQLVQIGGFPGFFTRRTSSGRNVHAGELARRESGKPGDSSRTHTDSWDKNKFQLTYSKQI